MKRTLYLIAATLLLSTMSFESQAQNNELIEGTKLIIIGGENVDYDYDDEIETFLLYRHRDYQGTKAPRYVITDRTATAMFSIGGFVNFRTAYDFPEVMPNLDFIPAQTPMQSNLSNRGHIFMDASTSRIFFESTINTGWGDPLRLYIESDFRGIDNSLHLRQAYIKYLGFKAGMAASTFSDINSAFHTVDFEGPNAFSYRRNLQLQYSYQWNNGLSMAVALELPTVAADYGTYTTQVYQQIPDIPVYIQYQWGTERHSHIRLSGVLRNMLYGDITKNQIEDKIGWGAQLSGTFAIGNHLRLYGQLLTGEGIAPYVQDLQGLPYDLVNTPDKMYLMNTLPVTSWFAGIELKLNDRMPLTLGYSQVLLTDRDDVLTATDYKLGQYIVANCFYNFGSAVSVGVEYLYGAKYNIANQFGKSQRIQAAVQFNF